jgi:Transposase DDE domain group 1
LTGLLRQSVLARPAGYEDVNDAERSCRDLAMRRVVGDRATTGSAASASQTGRFEAKWLSRPENLAALTESPGQWVDKVQQRRPSGIQASYTRASASLARPAERIVAFYNQRGTAEQWIEECKGAAKWTRLSCRTFAANAVRLQLRVLGYNLGNFLRTLAMPKTAEPWSLTSPREKLIKIGASVVSHGRYLTFQMAEVAVLRKMFVEILSLIARLRVPPAPA